MGRSQAHGYSFGWLVERGAGGHVKLVMEEWKQLECLMAQPLLQSIMPTSDLLRNNSQRSQRFFAVGPACYNSAFLVRFPWDKLLWETTDEAVTSIQALTAPYWIFNADEDENDLLPNEKMTQRILDKILRSASLPWKTSLAFILKVGENLRYAIQDGVQNVLPPHMAPWHTGYFKLKGLENTEEVGRSCWPSPTRLPWNRSPSCDRCPAYTQRKAASLSPKTKGSSETSRANFPTVYYIYLILSALSYSSTTVHSSSNQHKTPQV